MGLSNTVKPKRSLGQNFFSNKALASHIVNLVLDSDPTHITEIGPGTGVFTQLFHEKIPDMTLVEKDYELYETLKKTYPDIEIYNEDILEYRLTNKATTYYGSLPYNISKPIIRKIITSETFTNPCFFIIQKEVAEKYKNVDTNQLGLTREIYADCKVLLNIKPDNFKPRPNVMSSLITFIPHNKYPDIDKKELEKLIIQSFNQPRKTLNNNLKNSKYTLDENFKPLRPAQLSLDDYVSILNYS